MKHVVMFVCDALRADHVGCYGYQRNTTPNLDRLASDGIQFVNCFAPATWTRPVAASLVTGLYPLVHRVRQRENVLSPETPTLPRRLRENGYYTTAFSAMSNVSGATGFDDGIDEFFDLYLDAELVRRRPATNTKEEDFRLGDGPATIALAWAEDLVERFFHWHHGWSGDDSAQPFFAFFWSIDAHIPYASPERFRIFNDPSYEGRVDGTREGLQHIAGAADKRQLRDLYDNQILYWDYSLGLLIDYLREEDLYDNTLIVVLGDHGEAFWDHGHFGHGLRPFDELLHVPLIMKLPNQAHAGTPVDAMVSLVDVYKTVLEITGITDERDSKQTQSLSLMPLINGTLDGLHAAIYSETQPTKLHPQYVSVRLPDWKYIETRRSQAWGKSRVRELWRQIVGRGLWRRFLRQPTYYLARMHGSGNSQLFNLRLDPGEHENRLKTNPAIARKVQHLLQAWISECEDLRVAIGSKGNSSELDEDTWRHLRALGYVE